MLLHQSILIFRTRAHFRAYNLRAIVNRKIYYMRVETSTILKCGFPKSDTKLHTVLIRRLVIHTPLELYIFIGVREIEIAI